MKEVFDLVKEKTQTNKEKRATEFNLTKQTKVFKEGDMVLMTEHVIPKGLNKKISLKKQHDVFVVDEVLSLRTYMIVNLKTRARLGPVIGSQLTPYVLRDLDHFLPGGCNRDRIQEGTIHDIYGSGRRSTTRTIVGEKVKDLEKKFRVETKKFGCQPSHKYLTRAQVEELGILEIWEEHKKIKPPQRQKDRTSTEVVPRVRTEENGEDEDVRMKDREGEGTKDAGEHHPLTPPLPEPTTRKSARARKARVREGYVATEFMEDYAEGAGALPP
jgi:hypothetical protein